MNWMTSGRHRALNSKRGKRKQMMNFPSHVSLESMHQRRRIRDRLNMQQNQQHKQNASEEKPWYIKSIFDTDESHDIHMLEFNRSYDGGYVSQHNNDEFTERKEQIIQPSGQEEGKEGVGRCIFTPRKTEGRDINKHTAVNLPHESTYKTKNRPHVRESDKKNISRLIDGKHSFFFDNDEAVESKNGNSNWFKQLQYRQENSNVNHKKTSRCADENKAISSRQTKSRRCSFYDDSPEHTDFDINRDLNGIHFIQQHNNIPKIWGNNKNENSVQSHFNPEFWGSKQNENSVQPNFYPPSKEYSFTPRYEKPLYSTLSSDKNNAFCNSFDLTAKLSSPSPTFSQKLESTANSLQYISYGINSFTDTNWTKSVLSQSPQDSLSSQESMVLIENPPFRWQDKAFRNRIATHSTNVYSETPSFMLNEMLRRSTPPQECTDPEIPNNSIQSKIEIITKQFKSKQWKICTRTKRILINILKLSDEKLKNECSPNDDLVTYDAQVECTTISHMDKNNIIEVSSLAVYFHTLVKCYQIDQGFNIQQ